MKRESVDESKEKKIIIIWNSLHGYKFINMPLGNDWKN